MREVKTYESVNGHRFADKDEALQSDVVSIARYVHSIAWYIDKAVVEDIVRLLVEQGLIDDSAVRGVV